MPCILLSLYTLMSPCLSRYPLPLMFHILLDYDMLALHNGESFSWCYFYYFWASFPRILHVIDGDDLMITPLSFSSLATSWWHALFTLSFDDPYILLSLMIVSTSPHSFGVFVLSFFSPSIFYKMTGI